VPKKPTTALRAAPAAAKPRRLSARDLDRELERVGAKNERARSAAQPDVAEGRGVIRQPGRLLADGTRKGARIARRLTVYLPIELADELADRARRERQSMSDVAASALAEHWGIVLAS
jgi:hypothetical protein